MALPLRLGCLRAEIGPRVGVCWDWGWQWQLAVRLHQNSSENTRFLIKTRRGAARPYITMRDAPARFYLRIKILFHLANN